MDDDSLLFTLVVVICLFLIIYLYKRLNPTVITYLVTPQVIPQVIRIPVEDRVDLALDDKHNVHNKTLKRTAVHVIHQLNNCDQHHYTIKSALDDILELIRGDVVPPSPQRGASPPFRPPPFREGDLEGTSPRGAEPHFNPLSERGTETHFKTPSLKREDVVLHDDARFALQKIIAIDAFYQSGQIKELELIRLIWERIHHPINQNCVIELEKSLLEQLSDCCSDHQSVHCCEGRIMRLLQTLEIHDQEGLVELRPMWAYRDEISNRIIRYRGKLLNKTPRIFRTLETKSKLSSYDRYLLNQFNLCLIRNLNKRFEIDYIEKGLLTPNELDDLTKPYYDSLYDF